MDGVNFLNIIDQVRQLYQLIHELDVMAALFILVGVTS